MNQFIVPHYNSLIVNRCPIVYYAKADKYANYWTSKCDDRFVEIYSQKNCLTPKDLLNGNHLQDGYLKIEIPIGITFVFSTIRNLKYPYQLKILKKLNKNSNWEYFNAKVRTSCQQVVFGIKADAFNEADFCKKEEYDFLCS